MRSTATAPTAPTTTTTTTTKTTARATAVRSRVGRARRSIARATRETEDEARSTSQLESPAAPRVDDVRRARTSEYATTSGTVKTIVRSLTTLANAVRGGRGRDDEVEDLRSGRGATTSEELRERLAREFAEGEYLWTGDIDADLYDLACEFTDPTLSFVGLRTFKDNLESLQPTLRKIAPPTARRVELRSCELAGPNCVLARWRMVGNLRLPWRPKIDIEGETRFTFARDEDAFLRITSYEENWRTSASDALWQLVRPFAHETNA